MKNILFLSIAFLAFNFIGNAQIASKVKTYTAKQGEFVNFNPSKTDTLKSGDTISYVFLVTHTNSVNPLVDLRPLVIANDTTIALTVLESMDGVTYYAVNAGASPSAYTKTVAKGSTNIEYNGASDIVWFESRYLKLEFIAKAKSGFKKILSGRVKFNIR